MRKKVRVFIEKGDDGDYSAYMPDDDGLDYGITGEGSTIDETINDFKSVYEGMKQYYAENQKPFEEVEFVYSYDFRNLNDSTFTITHDFLNNYHIYQTSYGC